jgi:hypothetical protein
MSLNRWKSSSTSPHEDAMLLASAEGDMMSNGAERTGDPRWRRLTDERARGAKSVFQFDVQGSVAKSTHAGIPWLRFIRQHLGSRVHFWPFDGWDVPAGRSAIAEVYPALWSRSFTVPRHVFPQEDLRRPRLSPDRRKPARDRRRRADVRDGSRTAETAGGFGSRYPARAATRRNAQTIQRGLSNFVTTLSTIVFRALPLV